MIASLKEAAVAGLLIGVKWAVIIVVIAAALSIFLGDYGVTRQRALNGQKAFEFLAAQPQQQQAAAPVPK